MPTSTRDGRGRFVKGGPGGPGRPKGSAYASEFRELIGERRIKGVIDAMVARALEGDVAAARLVVERLFPVYDAKMLEMTREIDALRALVEESESKTGPGKPPLKAVR